MRRVVLCLGGLVLSAMAVLAGCAEEPGGIGFGGSPVTTEPPDAVLTGPVPPDGARPVAPHRVHAADLPHGYPRLVWTVGDGRVVSIYGQAGGCTEVRARLGAEHADTVRITVVHTTTGTGPCTRELRYPPLTVSLAEPLGERAVVLTRHGDIPG